MLRAHDFELAGQLVMLFLQGLDAALCCGLRLLGIRPGLRLLGDDLGVASRHIDPVVEHLLVLGECGLCLLELGAGIRVLLRGSVHLPHGSKAACEARGALRLLLCLLVLLLLLVLAPLMAGLLCIAALFCVVLHGFQAPWCFSMYMYHFGAFPPAAAQK